MKPFTNALKIFLFFTVLTGIAYPLFITGFAQVVFNEKANGSLIVKDNLIIGSDLIGQEFDSIAYFTSRPSAILYNPLPSGGSNFGLTNSRLKKFVEERREQFINLNNIDSSALIPSEMLFASASGIDPHISPEAAYLQVNRISEVRKFNDSQKLQLITLVKAMTENPQFSFLGEVRINVLKLNLELDKIKINDLNAN